MRLLVLGGTRFVGRHVVDAAVRRGHDVATFTRGLSGHPPEGVLALHGDRDDPPSLAAALSGAAARGWRPDVVVDTSCQTRAAAEQVAVTAWDVATPRAQETGLVQRTVHETVADTWAWLQAAGDGQELRADRPAPGLPQDLERELLASAGSLR